MFQQRVSRRHAPVCLTGYRPAGHLRRGLFVAAIAAVALAHGKELVPRQQGEGIDGLRGLKQGVGKRGLGGAPVGDDALAAGRGESVVAELLAQSDYGVERGGVALEVHLNFELDL